MTDERIVFWGWNRSSNDRAASTDSSFKTITSSNAESTNKAAFNLVFPKSKQRVVEAKL